MPADSATDERAVIRRHSKSFALAARLLAPAARRRAERLYAWCRHADDAIDHAPTPLAAAAALAGLRSDLDAVYAGRRPSSPAAGLLAAVVADCDLPRVYPEELLAGMAMDAGGARFRTLDDLLVYAHRVAGVVGLMMCHALGVSDDRAGPHAGALGIAMQLTNVARDVAEDWARGRLYLPLAWLGGEPPAGRSLEDAAVAPAVERLLAVADSYYVAGDAGLRYLDRRGRLAVRVARMVYSEIGARVRAAGCRPSAGRAIVPGWRKLAAALAATARELSTPRGSPVRRPAMIWAYRPGVGYVPDDTPSTHERRLT
jgi:phytoene synthase